MTQHSQNGEGVEVCKAAIYIAARFSQRPECHALAQSLKAQGHSITSRWVKPDQDHVLPTGLSQQAADSERRRFAMEDCDDVRACDWVVSLQGEPRSGGRGGRHVEFGYGLALGKRMISIGPRETVFHHLDQVEQFDTADEFLEWSARQSLAREPATADVGREALQQMRDDCQSTIDSYERNGPSYTSQATGVEYEHSSYVQAKMRELIAVADAALSRAAPSSGHAMAEGDSLAIAKARLSIAAVKARNSGAAKVEVVADDVAVLIAAHSDLDRQVSATTPPTTNDAIPAGWKLVPVEPTMEMLVAAQEDWMCVRAAEDRGAVIWSAMLPAAPIPEAAKEVQP